MQQNGYQFGEFHISPRMMSGIQRYIEQGIPPGSFLCAIIDNNLKEAVGRADNENLRNLPAFVAYFYNEAPGPCWGSFEKRQAWMEKKMADREAERAEREEE